MRLIGLLGLPSAKPSNPEVRTTVNSKMCFEIFSKDIAEVGLYVGRFLMGNLSGVRDSVLESLPQRTQGHTG